MRRVFKINNRIFIILQRDPEFVSFSGELAPFPRIIQNESKLYRYYPCLLKDTNVRFEIEEDILQQRSVLTYSLTSFTNSLKFTLDKEQLSDW